MNVLFLMTDQHRVDTLGCYGNDVVETPALDGLAASGTRFDRCYTPTAICTPARASLLTGLLPFRHRLLANHERNVGYPDELPDHLPVFSRLLRVAGWNVGLWGKWHVGRERGPDHYGFDGPHLDGWHNPVGHDDYRTYLEERGLPPYVRTEEIYAPSPNPERRNLLAAVVEQPVEATFEWYLTERTIEQLERYADEFHQRDRPFFLACQWFGPHLPYVLPRDYHERYAGAAVDLPPSVAETFRGKPTVQRRYSEYWGFDALPAETSRRLLSSYWGYVSLIDEQVGRLLSALEDLGLRGSTAVFFTADHGEFTGAHRLHDKGPAMYEDIYRIPALLRVPGSTQGLVDRHFTSLVDVTATIIDLAGLPPLEGSDGRSLLPLCDGRAPDDWREEITAEFHGHHFPYEQRMIRTGRYKLVVNPESWNELYDLSTDPYELSNRYEDPDLRTVREALLRRLHGLLHERGDNFHHWMSSMFDVGGSSSS